VPDRTLSPDNPDSNQHNFAFGIGYKISKITLDGFYNAGLNVDRSVNNAILSGKYKNIIHSFGINLGQRF
jgi:long-subunit fatty acid transport protein